MRALATFDFGPIQEVYWDLMSAEFPENLEFWPSAFDVAGPLPKSVQGNKQREQSRWRFDKSSKARACIRDEELWQMTGSQSHNLLCLDYFQKHEHLSPASPGSMYLSEQAVQAGQGRFPLSGCSSLSACATPIPLPGSLHRVAVCRGVSQCVAPKNCDP